MTFQLLGRVAVTADGRVVDVRRTRHRALLGLLLLAGGAEVGREAILASLWGGSPPRAPVNALHVYVRELRNLIDDALPGAGRQVVQTTPGGYRADVHPAAVDAAAFREWAEAGRRALEAGETPDAERHLDAALRLWAGPPLAGTPAHGPLAGLVGGLTEMHLTTTERQVDVLEALGRDEDAIALARRLVAEQPHRESASARLMVGLYRSGRQAEALDEYVRLHRHLVDERGTTPSPLARSVHRRILRHDPTLLAGRSTALVGSGREELVGRMRDVEGLVALLQGEGRVVTLAGPPGVGTTAVARAAAARLAARGRAVHWIDGAAHAGADDLTPTIAAIAPPGTDDMPAVVVIDGADADALAAVAGVARDGGLDLLCTSSRPLGLRDERVRRLAPLAVPPADASLPDEIGRYDAVRLFLRRARIVDLDFELDRGNAPAVAALCRTLDGLPLAIELAAQQTAALSVEDVLASVRAAPLDALNGGPDLPERQRSLRALVEDAVTRVGPTGRSALAAAGALPGGFDATLLGRVAGIDRDQALAAARELADAGLVRREAGHGATRWRPGAAVVARAREEADWGHVRRRRTTWARELPDPGAADAEVENLTAVLDDAVAAGDGVTASRIADRLRGRGGALGEPVIDRLADHDDGSAQRRQPRDVHGEPAGREP